MLGGTFWIGFLRNAIGAVIMMAAFLMLDRPKLGMNKTVVYYVIFGLLAVTVFSVWYLFDWDAYVRFSGLISLPAVGIFCSLMSSEGIYLSLYKISLGFYLLSLCVVVGIDAARWWFEGNIWADIFIRLIMMTGILYILGKRLRRIFLVNVEFLQEEMDLLSGITLVISFVIAALAAYWPNEHVFSLLSAVRIILIMFLTGVIQYLVFYLYLHLGREHCFEAEKQLLEMNEQLLRRQLEFRKTQGIKTEHICKNNAVDTILSAYEGYAKEENIEMAMEVTVEERLAVRDIDLVAILASILENAIQNCVCSGAEKKKIGISMVQKGHKMVIQCWNTCDSNMNLKAGFLKQDKNKGVGLYGIVRTVSRYDGETDFELKDGTLLIKVLLNLKAGCQDGIPYGKRRWG